MAEGYIALYRVLLDKPIWKKSTPEQKTILITLLLMANHEENEWEWMGQKFKVFPGQFVTSLDSIVDACGKGITIQNVRTALERFEKLEFLTSGATKCGRLITILKWQTYQVEKKKTNKDTNIGLTKTSHRTNKDLTPNNNDNNDNNDKKNIYSDYTTNVELLKTFEDFEVMRSAIKNGKMTDKARKMLLTELDKLASTDEKKIAILEQSIFNNWKGVFPLKEDKQYQQPQQQKPKKISNMTDRVYDANALEKQLLARSREELQ